MNVYIRYDRKCPVKFNFRDKFEELMRQLTIVQYKFLLDKKRVYIDNVLQPFKITCRDIEEELNNLVKVVGLHDGFRIYLSPMVRVKDKNLLTVLKAFDFGSEITGLPKPLFYPILLNIKKNITRYYLKYVGF